MTPDQRVRVWDLGVRAFHWAIAVCFVGSWVTAEAGFEWTETHFLFGYCTLGLVLFRVIWGIVGSSTARFAGFLRSPAAAWRHLADVRRERRVEPSVGHNAAGGYAVLALLLLFAVQALTGLFLSDDILYAGPYNAWVSNATAGRLAGWHELNFHLIQAMVVLHLIAIAAYRWLADERLVGPMITGYKPTDRVPPGTPQLRVSWVLLVVCAVFSVGAIVALVQLAPPPKPLY